MPHRSAITTPPHPVRSGAQGRAEPRPSVAAPRPPEPPPSTVERGAERAASAPGAPADGTASAAAPSAELVRLLAQLHSTVGRYVRERRQAGWPAARVLPTVKALVREASALEGWRDPADVLLAQVVRWTVAAYYEPQDDEPEQPHVARLG